jgi:hypothetical protein
MKAAQREWRPIAPKKLGSVLRRRLPRELAAKSPGRYEVLADLDDSAEKVFSSAEVHRLKALVVAEVQRHIACLPKGLCETRLGPLPDHLELDALGLKARTYNCLVRAGYSGDPQRLARATIGEVLAIRSFGATSLVDLMSALECYGSRPGLGDVSPRSGRPLAPKVLSPILQYPLPKKVATRARRRYSVLADLDASASSVFSPAEQRWLTSRIVGAVSVSVDWHPELITDAPLGPIPAELRLEDLEIKTRTYNCLARAGYAGNLQRLAEATVGDVFAITGFGAASLVDLAAALETHTAPSRVDDQYPADEGLRAWERFWREARKLAKMKHARVIRADDPRLRQLVRRVSGYLRHPLGPRKDRGVTVRDLAERLLTDENESVDLGALADAIRELAGEIRRLSCLTLEKELDSFLSWVSVRDRAIVSRRLGWDGQGGCTLQEAGNAFQMTKERVRQLEQRALANIKRKGVRPFAPAVDRALGLVCKAAPALDSDLADLLVRDGVAKERFSVDGLVRAARLLHREVPFAIQRLGTERMAVPARWASLPPTIRRIARRIIEQWGVGTVEDLSAHVVEATGLDADHSFLLAVLRAMRGFGWLDEEGGWFWLSTVPRNRLLTQIRKVMSVAPMIHVSELRSGVSRPHRMKGYSPPRRVLLELCSRLPGITVDGDEVIAAPPTDRAEVLGAGTEWEMARILEESGPLLTGRQFEALAVAAGINRSTFGAYLTYSPIIAKYAPGVYGLRGADFPPGQATDLALKPRRRKAVRDHGWTPDGCVWIGYRLSDSMVRTGILYVPAALKAIVAGEFQLETEDGVSIGIIKSKDLAAWGIGPLFSRRGGEPGDFLVIVFDLARRVATVSVGDQEIMERMVPGRADAP